MIKFNQGWPLNKSLKPSSAMALKGGRVDLIPPHIDDYDQWALVRARNQEFLQPYEPQWPDDCLTYDFYKRRLERQQHDVYVGSGQYFFLHHKKTKNIIGGLNLNNIQRGAAHHASLGYWIDKDYEGEGYMKEAISLAIDYSFKDLKLKRLNAACLVHNQRSIGLLKSLYFEEEGYAKKYLQINGAWQDHVLFGLTC